MLALVDTGAGITVASQSLVSLLGITKLEPNLVPSAVGMARIPVRFVGCATVALTIGNEELRQIVHFTETSCSPLRADSYNLILGNDVLRRLPPWSVDCRNRVFHMGADQLQILTYSIPVEDSAPFREFPVHAAETTVLHPQAETVVPCYVDQASVPVNMVMSAANVLHEGAALVSPAVFTKDRARLLVSNPTPAELVVYWEQRLTSARPLVESEGGTLSESPAWF
ncbi:hypothetical protein Q1695_002698 [Nippostrongylus brasiliensis]|nr:hypothetical protein Q1695_002698 [Nippostrongylus brasiliensis]